MARGGEQARFGPNLLGVFGPPPKEPAPVGWLCPACGCGNAPWMPVCGKCRPAPRPEGTTRD